MASDAAIAAMFNRRASHRSMFLNPPYTVGCPRCHAVAGDPCRRPDGEQRPAHTERHLVEDPQLRLPT